MSAPRRAGRTQAGTTVPATGLEPDPARRLRRHPGRRVGAGVGRGAATAAVPAGLGPDARALLEALDVAPRHVDELATGCRLTPARALAELLGLELQGHARQLPGARFVRA